MVGSTLDMATPGVEARGQAQMLVRWEVGVKSGLAWNDSTESRMVARMA